MSARPLTRRLGLTGAMVRPALLTGAVLALGAAVLGWANQQHSVRLLPTELYVILIAAFFTVLGIWAGRSLTRQRAISQAFVRNDAAVASLGITAREYDVLTHIAGGHSNKEIARLLGVSPNTIKTQAASLFARLDAVRRTDAVRRARALGIIP